MGFERNYVCLAWVTGNKASAVGFTRHVVASGLGIQLFNLRELRRESYFATIAPSDSALLSE